MSKLERIRAICAAQPKEPFGWYSLAMEEWKTDAAAAALSFARVRADFPAYLPNYYQYAKLLVERGETADAREVLQAGIALAQRTGDGHALGELSASLDQL